MNENVEVHKKLSETGNALKDLQSDNETLTQAKQQNDLEIMTLRKTCQLQKQTIESLEQKLQNLEDDLHHNRLDAAEKMNEKVKSFDLEKQELIDHYQEELRKQEDLFLEERTNMRERLHEVTSNEVNLLNRIKCLEAEEGYSHAEVEKVLVREREAQEAQRELKVRVNLLENELEHARNQIEVAKSQVVVKRSEEDIQAIADGEAAIRKLNDDITYYKNELLEARARKSASDDELGTIKDKTETLENSITSLSNESEYINYFRYWVSNF